MKTYLVGGAVRDEIMGQKSKDLDYSVVLSESEKDLIFERNQSAFDYMANTLTDQGYKIFVETPEFYTVRAQTPDRKETADFVLARKEGPYSDGRRPDYVKAGTLEDDLSRRDFCMNAIAKDTDGSYIDPFGGVADIEKRIIRAVGDPYERLNEDALRAVRALRFAVTKGFKIDPELNAAMDDREICEKIKYKISDERIQVELSKMFRFNTIDSLYELSLRNRLTTAMFNGSVSLDATMKTKGRGK